jgi:hypothetical protein
MKTGKNGKEANWIEQEKRRLREQNEAGYAYALL